VASRTRAWVETQPALLIHGLTKRHDDGAFALEDLDLEVPSGEFFGLLGPNCAGKTTSSHSTPRSPNRASAARPDAESLPGAGATERERPTATVSAATIVGSAWPTPPRPEADIQLSRISQQPSLEDYAAGASATTLFHPARQRP